MIHVNEYYNDLEQSFFFTSIRKKVMAFQKCYPQKKLINLGIGDVTLTIAPTVLQAMQHAVQELGNKETFRGYGPEEGYDFLKKAIAQWFLKRNIEIEQDEIFIGDGIKSDIGAITDIFHSSQTVLIPNPVYPAYVDVSIMQGYQIYYLNANEENEFLGMPDGVECDKLDIIYICSPNNPTGATYSHEQLQKWVDYAIKNGSIILFDAAYECFIQDESVPKSIYEIPGARECAIEFYSLSKTAGFTGVRCGYTIVPKQLMGRTDNGSSVSINNMWRRRQSTKFNGVSYVIQRAAEAVFTEVGQNQIKKITEYYIQNAEIICKGLNDAGIRYYGGRNAPYVWLKCKEGYTSWEFFQYLLENAGVIGTPGEGFGKNGEGYFRLTAFGNREDTIQAMENVKMLIK